MTPDAQLLGAAERTLFRAGARPRPAAPPPPRPATPCLRCELLGSHRLLCAGEDACRERARLHPLGPALLAAWLAIALAFVAAVG